MNPSSTPFHCEFKDFPKLVILFKLTFNSRIFPDSMFARGPLVTNCRRINCRQFWPAQPAQAQKTQQLVFDARASITENTKFSNLFASNNPPKLTNPNASDSISPVTILKKPNIRGVYKYAVSELENVDAFFPDF